MLSAAFIVLVTAMAFGAALAVLHMRPAGAVPWPLAALHGLMAIGGLGCLLLALRGPPRGLDTGTASFGTIAAVLLALAALAGGGIVAARLRRRRPAGALIGIHASLAIGGLVILAVYLAQG
jgi:hypothetical protein